MPASPLLVARQSSKRDKSPKDRDADTAARLLSKLFQKQRDFVKDRARRKAALCPRRAGKSFSVLVYALIVALRRPAAKVLILARVRRQVKGVFWADLRRLCAEYEIKAAFRGTTLECELPNGSLILLAGADTQEEIDKYRGQGYDLVVIDECKSYSASLLDELIREIIQPALSDRRGTLVLIGTPGPIPKGLFWAITTYQNKYKSPWDEQALPIRVRPWEERESPEWKGKPFQWSCHSWTARDNDKCPWIWEEHLQIKEENGYEDDNPIWLIEYMGQWVTDHDALVFAYHKVADHRCDFLGDGEGPFGLPAQHEWHYLLGVDLGWHDATAFVVAAWSPTHPVLHFVHSEKHARMIVEQVAARTRELEEIYGGFDVRVIDTGGLGRMIVESIRKTYGISFIHAKKTDKLDHIRLMNSDILTGRVAVDPLSPLAEEWRTAQWLGSDHLIVDPKCEDDASDAALYLWRWAYHHFSREKIDSPQKGSDEWRLQQKRKEIQRAIQVRNEQNDPLRRLRALMDELPQGARISQILSDYSRS